MEGVEIRLACEEDTPALAALITELGFPTNPAEMASRLARIRGRSNYATLVAAANGILVGMAGLSVSPSFLSDTLDAQIIAFVVADGQRGRGIGRALLAQAETWFAKRGAKRISLASGLHRPGAHAFYRACGYEHTGLRFVRMIG